jgi:hypothetical protein
VCGIAGAALQSRDPQGLARRWAEVLERKVTRAGEEPVIELDGGTLRFLQDRDGRGDGLAEIDLRAPDPERVRAAASARRLPVGPAHVEICGTRFRLLPA